MDFSIDRVRDNVARAETADLLDRVTVYAAGLEPEAVAVIMEELKSRGVTPEAVVEHEKKREHVAYDSRGVALQCVVCRQPAILWEWGWYKLFGKIPLWPRKSPVCDEHCSDYPGELI